ncbi:MAG: 16S rRNA (cytosine(1402)-N(4))-methyltransferase RsmH [Actinomycetota bacterium]|nr:16S rRNA (cytosine(1402)-N(4))-methyltransferase RsmH [Actinomycetota bacterium]
MDWDTSSAIHQPVMVQEVIEFLRPGKGKVIVDATVGTGGHLLSILRVARGESKVIGIDRDPKALEVAESRLGEISAVGKVSLYCENFRNIRSVLDREGVEQVDGILLDLGFSSLQLEDSSRGFSFRHDGLLDMRMGPDAKKTAGEIVNSFSEGEIAKILYQYGEEKWARRIARFIVQARERRPIKSTFELVKIVEDAVPVGARRGRKHPARKTFQALRIAVNEELDSLKEVITKGVECLASGGRIVVLSYHSLEDRLVKQMFGSLARESGYPPTHPLFTAPSLMVVTKKPVVPTREEIESNPRSKSAKLRVAERREG